MEKINPKVVEWAMKRSGESTKSLEGVSKKIDKWLTGDAQPTLRQIQDFAKRTHISVSLLFSKDVPHLGLQIADFRTPEQIRQGRRKASEPSPELYDTINQMMYRQDWMHAYFLEQEYGQVGLVGCLDKEKDQPEAAADKIRECLSIGKDWALSMPTVDAAFAYLKDAVEKVGISVAVNGMVGDNTSRLLDPDEFRGFVLSDDVAPVVFINGRDAKVAQIFTLAHELAHLGFADIGVVAPAADEDGSSQEDLCNGIAACLLMPRDTFCGEWHNDGNAYAAIERAAKRFRVSFVACARRAEEFGFIGEGELNALCARHRLAVEQVPAKKGGKGGNFYANKKYRLGSVFSDAIWIAVNTHQLTYTEAFGLTGMTNKTFSSYYADVATW